MRRAFSILEVMIALAVLSVAILGLIGLFPTVFSTDRKTMFSSIALYDAESQMDAILKANTYVSTTAVVPPNGSPPLSMPNGTLSYQGSAVVSGQAQTVTVTIVWVEAGRVRSVSLQSEVSP